MSARNDTTRSDAPPSPEVSLDAAEFNPSEMYVFLRDTVVPRPIAWVSTVSESGATNLAPFSFFNVVCPFPPVLGFSCGPRGDDHNAAAQDPKDTLINIQANREFVVNIVPGHLTEPMVKTSDPLAHDQSEFAHAGLVEVPSTKIRPPRVGGVPVAFECRLYDILDVGVNVWIMGTVVHIHVDPEAYIGTRGALKHRVDVMKRVEARPVGRLDRANYVQIREVEMHLRKEGPR